MGELSNFDNLLSFLRNNDDAGSSIQRKHFSGQDIGKYLQSKLPDPILKRQPPGNGARVIRDRYGVSHIFAENDKDLWFACGYVQAQDRLWQLDYRHRKATGKLAAAIGDEGLAVDAESRTIGFERAAQYELDGLDDHSVSVLESYSLGVNAWVDLANDDLPVEFDVLDYTPLRWSPVASLSILREFWWLLTGRLFQIVGAEQVLRNVSPVLARKYLTAEAARYIVPGASSSAEPAESLPEGGGDDGTGSNNWVVGPSRSTTGFPSLASDPHWPVHFPDLWYEQHLVSPNMDVIGASYAGVPPVVFGRTRKAVWARTNNVSSTRDLYHERLDPDDSNRYLEGDTSVPFEVIKEQIEVKGGETVELDIRLTERGPIVNEFIPQIDPEGDGPISLKCVGHEPIGDLKSLLELNQAQSADDVKQTLSNWRLSVWNSVYADDSGNFGYQMSGNVPTRGRKTRGTRDASAPKDQWTGSTGTDFLPGFANPKQGWAGSANNTPGPVSLLGEITGTYADGYRFGRIQQVLSEGDPLTPSEVRALQSDNLDLRATDLKDPIVDLLKSTGDADCLRAAEILAGWNCRYEGQSAGPAVWSSLWSRFVNLTGNALLGTPAADLMADSAGSILRSFIRGEENPQNFGLNLEHILVGAASGALGYLQKTFGSDDSQWAWEKSHQVTLVHPFATTDALKGLFNLGPFPCPGGGGTVNNRRPVETPTGYENASGVSYRLFADMSEPGRAWGATLAGQSGQPGSAHYDDRVTETLNNEYHPLLMDREDIYKELEHEYIAPSDPTS